MMNPRTATEEKREQRGGEKMKREAPVPIIMIVMIYLMMLLLMLIMNMYLQKLLWLIHPLMLQIVASPGVVATVWDKKPLL